MLDIFKSLNLKKPQETASTKYMKIATVILIIVVILLEFRKCNKDDEENAAIQTEQIKEISPQEALEMEKAFHASKKYLKEALPNADSISFPDYGNQVEVNSSNGKIFIIKTWVDEINQSGINIRHNYSAEMERINGLDWQCRSLILDEKE